jgi:hypothetical protein
MTTLRNQPLAQWSDDEIAERTVKAIGLRQRWRYPDFLNTLSAAGDRTLMERERPALREGSPSTLLGGQAAR